MSGDVHRSKMSFRWRVLAAAAPLMAASCAGDDAASSRGLALLDPSEVHYGKTYAEWAAEWVRYVHRHGPPECNHPIMDRTGEHCAENQAADSPVFFLTGVFGGVAYRDRCVVPADKALFFPLLNTWGDNAGVPPDMQLTPEALRDYVQSNFELTDADALVLNVDGEDVPDLEKTGIPYAPYTVEIPPEPNVYSCGSVSGVEGVFSGYLSGYWALLPPLGRGRHRLEFGGLARGPDVDKVNAVYQLTIE
jgi:hypothetical protein